jgi:hypothetical protein
MKAFRITLICLALVAGTSALSYAQNGRPERGHRDNDDRDKKHDSDNDRHDDDRYRNSAAYLDGMKFGRQDAEHHKNKHAMSRDTSAGIGTRMDIEMPDTTTDIRTMVTRTMDIR